MNRVVLALTQNRFRVTPSFGHSVAIRLENSLKCLNTSFPHFFFKYIFIYLFFGCTAWHVGSSVQFSSVIQSCPTLCDPMNCSTPGLPVHHQLPESTQTHVHQVDNAIQPSHPLSSPFPTLNLSQHQGLFQ